MRRRFRHKKPPSRQERRFLLYWQSFGGPELKCEFTFHPTRRQGSDFAHIESRTLIEIDGGIWIQVATTARRGSLHTPRSIWKRRWSAGASFA